MLVYFFLLSPLFSFLSLLFFNYDKKLLEDYNNFFACVRVEGARAFPAPTLDPPLEVADGHDFLAG